MSEKKSASRSESDRAADAGGSREPRARSWCLAVGLFGLLVWLIGGGALEALHGLKVADYLQDDLRREMWTLAHAHGTLFSLACLVLSGLNPSGRSDRLFATGAVLLPLGFLFGGVMHSESDPGIAILLVPAGGLLCAAALTGMLLSRRRGA